jgi:hypothetical protein
VTGQRRTAALLVVLAVVGLALLAVLALPPP